MISCSVAMLSSMVGIGLAALAAGFGGTVADAAEAAEDAAGAGDRASDTVIGAASGGGGGDFQLSNARGCDDGDAGCS